MNADRKKKFPVCVNLSASAAFLLCVAAHAATIRLENGVFRVDGWKPGDYPAEFGVYVGNSDTPMLGASTIERGSFVFYPRFPLSSGVTYRAVFHPLGQPSITAIFDGPPRKTGPPTEVVQVYPSASWLPANTLSLYIVFSAPMSRGEASRRITLLDRDGKAVELPFLEIQQELWSPDNQRLMVLFSPCRIKRGLVPNQEDGPPLKEGGHYSLVVDDQWRDAQGLPLKAEYIKGFE